MGRIGLTMLDIHSGDIRDGAHAPHRHFKISSRPAHLSND